VAVGPGRHHDDGDVAGLAQGPADLEPVHAGEHEVDQGDIGRLVGEDPQRLLAAGRLLDLVALVLQRHAHGRPDASVVLQHQDASSHRSGPSTTPGERSGATGGSSAVPDRPAPPRGQDDTTPPTWQFGSSLEFVRRLIARWQDGFDWRAQEAKLNAFDQFQVPIDGINLHFIHQPGSARTPCRSSSSTAGRDRCTHPATHRSRPIRRRSGGRLHGRRPSLPGFTLSFQPGQRRLGIVAMADLSHP
jgi:hypothetical protein